MIVKVWPDVTPANLTFDFNDATQLDWEGPFWVALTGWVQTADVAAGSIEFKISYVDPTGTTRDMNFNMSTFLNLTDGSSFFATPVVSMSRQSGSSLWNLVATLGGSAGSSKIHFEVQVAPESAAAVQPFGGADGNPL